MSGWDVNDAVLVEIGGAMTGKTENTHASNWFNDVAVIQNIHVVILIHKHADRHTDTQTQTHRHTTLMGKENTHASNWFNNVAVLQNLLPIHRACIHWLRDIQTQKHTNTQTNKHTNIHRHTQTYTHTEHRQTRTHTNTRTSHKWQRYVFGFWNMHASN